MFWRKSGLHNRMHAFSPCITRFQTIWHVYRANGWITRHWLYQESSVSLSIVIWFRSQYIRWNFHWCLPYLCAELWTLGVSEWLLNFGGRSRMELLDSLMHLGTWWSDDPSSKANIFFLLDTPLPLFCADIADPAPSMVKELQSPLKQIWAPPPPSPTPLKK